MLNPKELLELTPPERDIILLRCLWRFLFKKDFTIVNFCLLTKHSEDFVEKTLKKYHSQARLKMEIYNLEAEIKKILSSLFYERENNRQPDRTKR